VSELVIGNDDEGKPMTEHDGAALDTALAYHRAWTSGDFNRAMTHVAEGVICFAPSGRHEGSEAFRAFMAPFANMLTRSELLAAYGDDSTAALVYDTDTVLVSGAPAAELITVVDGRIARLLIIFDSAPFAAARRARAEGTGTAGPEIRSAPR
jgi:hypothetical protein